MLSGHWSCGKRVETFHFGLPAPVGQEAERVGNDQRIVDLALSTSGWPMMHQRRARLAGEQPFHGGQGDGLIVGDHAALAIAGGKQLQDAEDQPSDHADSSRRSAHARSNLPHSR